MKGERREGVREEFSANLEAFGAVADKKQVAAGGHIAAKRLASAFWNVGEVPVRDDAERIREVGAPVGWPGVGHLG